MFDAKDKKILSCLQQDGRASASSIANQVGLSIPAVTERMKKLQDQGIILGYQVVISPRAIGLDVGAIITLISDSSDHYGEVVINARKHAEVLQCFSTTGRGSHVLIVRSQNTKSLEQLLRAIQMWPGVKRTETQLILSSYIDKLTQPLHSE